MRGVITWWILLAKVGLDSSNLCRIQVLTTKYPSQASKPGIYLMGSKQLSAKGERGRECLPDCDEYYSRESRLARPSSFITSKGTKCYEQLEFLPKLPPLYHDRRDRASKMKSGPHFLRYKADC